MFGLGAIAGGVVKAIAGALSERSKRKHEVSQTNHELKIAKIKAKAKVESKELSVDEKIIEANQNTYKDEVVLAILLLPVVLAFIPNPQIQEAVANGFAIIETTPAWFMTLVFCAIVNTLGMRSVVNKFLATKLPFKMPGLNQMDKK